jgi:hypothetical protein
MSKICPLMSGKPTYSERLARIVQPGFVNCVEERCQFWITTYTSDNQKIDGCCHELFPVMIDHRV